MQRSPDDAKLPPLTSQTQITPGKNATTVIATAQDTQTASATTAGTTVVKTKKFLNGWTRQLETLSAEWADKAACYKWMHEKSDLLLNSWNLVFTIPVILLSTLTGTANFGVTSLIPNEAYIKYANAVIGGISLLAGLISTVANFLRYAQASEAHRVAAISWGKFQRFISTELALHPNERMDAMSFLKMGRVELDRLIEQSPIIPQSIISAFEKEFGKKTDLKRPEIVGGLEHTKFFDDRDSRLARVAADAALLLAHKKRYMLALAKEDIDKKIAAKVLEQRVSAEKEILEELTHRARDAALRVLRAELDLRSGTLTPKTSKNMVVTAPTPTLEIVDIPSHDKAQEAQEEESEATVLEVQPPFTAATVSRNSNTE